MQFNFDLLHFLHFLQSYSFMFDAVPGQENHAGSNVPNGVINRNNQEEHDRTSERNTKSGVSVLERSPSSIRSYHSDRFSVNTPTHSIVSFQSNCH